MKKILWFSNHVISIEKSANNELKNHGRGWVGELEYGLRDYNDLEIAVATPDNTIKTLQKTTFENRTLYRIPFPASKFNRWKMRFLGKLEGPEFVNKYLEVVNDYQPDLIHIYGTENSFGEIITKVNIPVIVDLQGILSLIVNKWYSSISKFESFIYSSFFSMINIKTHYHDYKVKVKRGEREKRFLKTAKFVVGRTHWDKAVARVMAPNAVYMNCSRVIKADYWNTDWKMPEGHSVSLLSIMNEDFYKGLDVVYKACDILVKHGLKFTWKIAGIKASSDYVKIVEKKTGLKAKKLNIDFLGKMSSANISELMKDSNFFVHTSYIENSPNSVCEAMVCGVPSIATNVGGVSSFITNGVSGWTIQEGDYTMLAGLIVSLSENKELVEKVSTEGKNRARKRHNVKDIIEETIENYNAVLNNNK